MSMITDDTTDEVQGQTESGRSRPTFGILEVADDLPPQDKPKRAGGGPNMRIHNLLEQVMVTDDLHGKWVKIVGYSTPNGAKLAYDAIEDGTRLIPDGDFDFEVRRVTDEATGKRVSELWARYNGVA